MNSIEIFAGGGGLALGVSKAGFDHSFLVEWDQDSAKTLYHNHEHLKFSSDSDWIFNGDIHEVNFEEYRDSIDLISGGPPCQPFSLGGKHRAYNDKRDLFSEATRALNEVRPKAFIFENVRGLLRKSFSRYFGYIILQLTYPQIQRSDAQRWEEHLEHLEQHHTSKRHSSFSYNVVFRLVNSADYGIPQQRERVIIVGYRNDIAANWSFPEPTHTESLLEYEKNVTGEYWERHGLSFRTEGITPSRKVIQPELDLGLRAWRTTRDAIADLPLPEEMATFPNHRFQPGAKSYPGHTGSLLDRPAKTIKAGGHGVPGGENMVVQDDGSFRYFTIREAARLQTFPDDFYFPCSWTESMRQIGNAVPVELGRIVADSVRETLILSESGGIHERKGKPVQSA